MMHTPKPQQKSAHLLDDLESIRQLLGDDNLQPPLLTDTVEPAEVQIPLLFDVIASPPAAPRPAAAPTAAVAPPPTPAAAPVITTPVAAATAPAPAPAPAPAAERSGADALLHLDSELRAAAQLIMQDVIDDFAPHIETEIKRRLDARLERLLATATSGKP